MGYNKNTITIDVLLSSHNSMNDDLDYVRWIWLQREIAELMARHFGPAGNVSPLIGEKIGDLNNRWEISTQDDRQGGYLLSKESFQNDG